MQIADIDSKRNVINIRHAKGDKDRIVPLSEKILNLLREYFKQYKPKKWLFEGQIAETQYTETSLNKVFQKQKTKQVLHSLVRYIRCAIVMLRICWKAELISATFKHCQDINTVNIYPCYNKKYSENQVAIR
jgi:integrase